MDVDKLEGLAGGRIFTGRMAVENGLVDKLGTLSDAIDEAKGLAGFHVDEKVDLQILPKPKSFFEQLIEGPSADAEVRLVRPSWPSCGVKSQSCGRFFSVPWRR